MGKRGKKFLLGVAKSSYLKNRKRGKKFLLENWAVDKFFKTTRVKKHLLKNFKRLIKDLPVSPKKTY